MHQYLTFFVHAEEYAIPILRIREILQFSGATRVPGMPPAVLGVINLRGRVVPVIDLSCKFAAGSSPITPRSCVVIVEAELGADRVIAGLLADSVHQVVELPPEAIEPPPSFGRRTRIDFLRGVGRDAGGFIMVLDVDLLVTSAEVAAETLPETA